MQVLVDWSWLWHVLGHARVVTCCDCRCKIMAYGSVGEDLGEGALGFDVVVHVGRALSVPEEEPVLLDFVPWLRSLELCRVGKEVGVKCVELKVIGC